MYGPVSVEESVLPSECLVYKLVNYHKLAGLDFAAKRTHRARRYYRLSAKLLEGEYIRGVWDLAGR